MKQAMPNVSERRVCVVMSVSRSAVRERPEKLRVPIVDEVLALRLQRLIAEHPTFGYRRLWALLRFHEGLRINRKAVYRVLVVKRWFVHQRRTTPRPRVQGRRSRASRSNERWRWTSPTSVWLDSKTTPQGGSSWTNRESRVRRQTAHW